MALKLIEEDFIDGMLSEAKKFDAGNDESSKIMIAAKKIIIETLGHIKNRLITPTTFREEDYPDTEADGYVFCGKCGKMK